MAEFKQAARAVLMVPVDKIDVPEDRLRSLKKPQAEAIGRAIAADRQYDPITVRMRVGTDRYWLVDGLHRLKGCESVGITEIEARMGPAAADAALRQEVLSAWARAGDDAFDKAAQVAGVVDMVRGADNSEINELEASAMMALATKWDDAACEVLGVGRRNLFRYLKLQRAFSPEEKKLLRERGMADELVPLVRLADLPPEDRAAVLGWIAEGAVASLAEAFATLSPAAELPEDKQARSVIKKIDKWHPQVRARLIKELLTKYDRYGNEKSPKVVAG